MLSTRASPERAVLPARLAALATAQRAIAVYMLPATERRRRSAPIEGSQADAELAGLAKALGHPARVKILRLLNRHQGCICGEIVEGLDLAQSTVSQHLKMLKGSGLIRGDIDGPRICYCIEPRALRRLRALVGSL